MEFFQAGGSIEPELGKKHRPMGRKFLLQEETAVIQYCICFRQQPIIILPHQDNIQIIIPWNKPLMPHRSQHGTGKQLIWNLQLTAHGIQLTQQRIQCCLMLLQ